MDATMSAPDVGAPDAALEPEPDGGPSDASIVVATCTDSAGCGGYPCFSGRCSLPCANDGACGPGRRCSMGVCVEAACGPCLPDGSCPDPHEECWGTTCIPFPAHLRPMNTVPDLCSLGTCPGVQACTSDGVCAPAGATLCQASSACSGSDGCFCGFCTPMYTLCSCSAGGVCRFCDSCAGGNCVEL